MPIKQNKSTQILSTLKRLDSGQNELRSDFKKLESGQNELQIGFNNLGRQFQGQRADIIKMKEEILGAFDGLSLVSNVSAKVELHEVRIKSLEQKSAVFETALKVKEKPLS